MIHLDKGNSLSPGARLLMTSECESHVRADPNALCYASHICFVLVTYNGRSLLLLGKFYFILMTSNFSINLKVKNIEVRTDGHRECFWDHENILKLDCDSCTTL